MRLRLNQPIVRSAVGLILLGIGGLALLPFGAQIRQAEMQAGLLTQYAHTGNKRDALMEQLSFFTLGGMRSLAAEILLLDATTAWIERDWPRAERRWHAITSLCPQRPNYWMSAARDMAVNAASHATHDDSLSPQMQTMLSRSYIERGVRFLLSGIAHQPDNPQLYAALGDIYADLNRRPDFTKAAEAYHAAVERGASPLYRRMEFYNLCRIRGREQEAWRLGRELFEAPGHRLPSVKCLLFVLENKLGLPAEDRLSVEEIFGSEQKARKELTRFERNSLRFPIYGISSYLRAAE